MHDDEFSNIVRSGTEHHVSVSEHTGNAKTPKNIVTSHEEETAARKRAFEAKELAALEAEKALAEALAEHSEHLGPTETDRAANIQKVADSSHSPNRQAIASDAPAKANVQSVGVDNLASNIQSVPNGKGMGDNRQDVATGAIASNRQNVATDVLADNLQSVGGGNIAANRQDIPTDVTATNQQSVGTDHHQANHQAITGDQAGEPNRQSIPTEAIPPNVQDILVESLADNLQDIGSHPFGNNTASIDQETEAMNRQAMDNGLATAANLQPLPNNEVAANRQPLGQNVNAKNQASLPTEAIDDNTQPLSQLGAQNNPQAIAQESFVPNRQAIPAAPGMAPNAQSLGTQAPTLNRQGIDNEHIQSHFETLPSETIERKTVDFSGPAGLGTAFSHAKTAVRQPASKKVLTPRPPMSAAELQEAKLKREKLMEEFHGRVAGIKHNVDTLNERLTDFEEQAHKDEAILEKGNPDHFDVRLK